MVMANKTAKTEFVNKVKPIIEGDFVVPQSQIPEGYAPASRLLASLADSAIPHSAFRNLPRRLVTPKPGEGGSLSEGGSAIHCGRGAIGKWRCHLMALEIL